MCMFLYAKYSERDIKNTQERFILSYLCLSFSSMFCILYDVTEHDFPHILVRFNSCIFITPFCHCDSCSAIILLKFKLFIRCFLLIHMPICPVNVNFSKPSFFVACRVQLFLIVSSNFR